jgi:DNA-binding NarL/FixJ family response regulator
MTQHSPLAHRRRALIVDDELMVAIGLKADMQALGFDVCDVATNRQEAFLLAMSDQPDVVLMDVYLAGGREGIEAARWLHEVCEVPIIFVTEYTDCDTLERIHRQVPGASVLHKPVSRQGLFDAVAEVSKVHTADLRERYVSTTV